MSENRPILKFNFKVGLFSGPKKSEANWASYVDFVAFLTDKKRRIRSNSLKLAQINFCQKPAPSSNLIKGGLFSGLKKSETNWASYGDFVDFHFWEIPVIYKIS